MWTETFIGLVLVLIGTLAVAYGYALFEKAEETAGWLVLAVLVAIAAGYTGYRAFW